MGGVDFLAALIIVSAHWFFGNSKADARTGMISNQRQEERIKGYRINGVIYSDRLPSGRLLR